MRAGTVEADEGAEFGGGLGVLVRLGQLCVLVFGDRGMERRETNPLGSRSTAVAAFFVAVCFGELEELLRCGLWIRS